MKTKTNHGAEISLPVTINNDFRDFRVFVYANEFADALRHLKFCRSRGLRATWINANIPPWTFHGYRKFVVKVPYGETLPDHIHLAIMQCGGIISTQGFQP